MVRRTIGPVLLPAVALAGVLLLTSCSAAPPPAATATPTASATPAASATAGPSSSASTTAAADPARLHVSGDQVVTAAGTPIVLRGYNWGQWGTAQPEDAAANLAQGANSVRIPIRWWGQWKPGTDSRDDSAPGHIDPAHLALLDRTIAEATSHHLWVVLFADSNDGQGADGHDDFWNDPAMRTEYFQMWSFLAARYAHTPYIAAYELLAEPRPSGVADSAVRSFYESLIATVRKVDPRTPLVVGPNDGYNAAHLDGSLIADDHDLIYTADYFIFDNAQNKLRQITAFRAKYHVPVWINQVGIPSGKPDSLSKAGAVLTALDTAGIGWAWWTYRDVGTSGAGEGVYYRSSSGGWTVKQPWLDLVGKALAAK